MPMAAANVEPMETSQHAQEIHHDPLLFAGHGVCGDSHVSVPDNGCTIRPAFG